MPFRRMVKKRSLHYSFIKNHLDGEGYSVYPTEINCLGKHCPDPNKNLIVDVAGYKNGMFYAFEYKSNGDQLTRALAQVQNYAVSFDLVVVIAQIPRRDMSLNFERGKRIHDFIKLGAGIWTVHFPRNAYNIDALPIFKQLIEPQQQTPHPDNRKWIENKFKRYVWGLPCAEDPYQKTIEVFSR